MAFEFKLPDLGEGIQEAQIISVSIEQGQTVTEDQLIMEVETDKAAVELPISRGGTVQELLVKAGDTVKVGQVLVVINESGAAAAPAETQQATTATAASPAAARHVETVGGDRDSAAQPSTATAVAERRTPSAGVTGAIVHKGPVPATPSVRRLARELGIDLRMVPGNGPGGRVLAEDVQRFRTLGGVAAAPVAPVAPTPAATPRESRPPQPAEPSARTAAAPQGLRADALPDFAQWGPITREPVPQIRKAIARQMTRSWLTVPRVTHGDEADLTDLETMRKQYARRQTDDADAPKLTITAFMIKALAATLQKHPKLNASYDDQAHEIVWKHYVHIGIAVDAPRGLIVPCLRDVEKKGLATISRELQEMSARIRESKFDIAELRGGTFTLSNVGALGGTFSTPMVNYPETAILVTGRLVKKPVVRDDQIVIRKIMPLALSFDHRIIDGADAARFTRTLVDFLENPLSMLMAD
ncbi:MAG: dihydrolipoamide acetyltransferase family protein [Phycisphaerae bacterium]